MKKIKYLLIIIFFILILSGCHKEKTIVEQTDSTPLLFEVTKEGQDNKLYLFGSIHAADESVYPLPSYIEDAYEKSDEVAVEFDLIEMTNNLETQVNNLAKFINKDGKNIKDIINEDSYNEAVTILKNAGVYNSLWEHYNPMMWYSLIETASMKDSELSEEKGIDLHILKKAKEDKKEIIELESADYQYEMLLSFEEELQIYILEHSISAYNESVDELKKLFELYKKGNKKDLENFLFNENNNSLEEEKFNDVLVTNRNKNMTESLKSYFNEEKNIFCTVGLAHIIGNDGIAASLEKEGYIVKQIVQ